MQWTTVHPRAVTNHATMITGDCHIFRYWCHRQLSTVWDQFRQFCEEGKAFQLDTLALLIKCPGFRRTSTGTCKEIYTHIYIHICIYTHIYLKSTCSQSFHLLKLIWSKNDTFKSCFLEEKKKKNHVFK